MRTRTPDSTWSHASFNAAQMVAGLNGFASSSMSGRSIRKPMRARSAKSSPSQEALSLRDISPTASVSSRSSWATSLSSPRPAASSEDSPRTLRLKNSAKCWRNVASMA